jgi:signal transduction histidine kinase
MLLDDLEEGDRIMALETAIDAGSDKGFLPTLLFYRGTLIEIYLGQNDLQNAIRHAKQGLIETEKVEDKRYESDYHQYLFQIHEKLKNYEKAIYHLQVHHQLKDKLEDIRVSQNLDELNIQYETIKKESQIKQQELDLQKSRYQRNLLLAGFGMALWLGAFLIAYFWNRTRVTKRISIQETQIQEQKIQQLEQEKSLLAMSSMIEGQEAERKRIAQDLHDGLGGLLSNIKAQLHAIERRVNALTNLDVYGKASEMIDEASKEVRRIAYNMMPVTLSRLGLKAAIEDLVSEITKHHDLNVDLQLFGLDKRLDETEEVMLYRIVQELCNNVVKHAGATKMMVQTNRIGSDLILVVEDNGKGFDPVFTQSESGIGLKSIESRIKFLHSEIDISSSELGTCVTIQVPLKIQ